MAKQGIEIYLMGHMLIYLMGHMLAALRTGGDYGKTENISLF